MRLGRPGLESRLEMMVAYTTVGAGDRLRRYSGGRISVWELHWMQGQVSGEARVMEGWWDQHPKWEHLPGPGLGEGGVLNLDSDPCGI